MASVKPNNPSNEGGRVPEAVRRVARNSRSPDVIVRCWLLHAGGMNIADVSREVKRAYPVVYTWINNIKEEIQKDEAKGIKSGPGLAEVTMSLSESDRRLAEMARVAQDEDHDFNTAKNIHELIGKRKGWIAPEKHQHLHVGMMMVGAPPEERARMIEERAEELRKLGVSVPTGLIGPSPVKQAVGRPRKGLDRIPHKPPREYFLGGMTKEEQNAALKVPYNSAARPQLGAQPGGDTPGASERAGGAADSAGGPAPGPRADGYQEAEIEEAAG